MKEIQTYALERGVVVVPEIRLPGHAASWRHADEEIVAACDVLRKQNPTNVALNPLSNKTYEYIKGMIRETIEGFFPAELQIYPVVHLGGDAVNFDCWTADTQIMTYLLEKRINASDLWKEF